MASGGARMSRDELKKARDLEEARKAGTVPPAKDEDGKDINPHIPQYIAQAPWYLQHDQPGLKHQRQFLPKPEFASKDDWYARGQKAGPATTKFRKGACKNCGAMTHTEKFCCERPRKLGAKWTGKDIQPDEVIQQIHLDFDGTRDRWNGYDPEDQFKTSLEQYEQTELERRRKKKMEELNAFSTEPDPTHNRFPHSKDTESKKPDSLVDSDSESDSDTDSKQQEDKSDFLDTEGKQVGVKKDPKTRTTIRNLRIREDVAKYLRNLDPNSAHYDPKSRSMRDNPTPHLKPEEALYIGDNFVRGTGEVGKFAENAGFAFTGTTQGIHMQANPSLAELQFKEHKEKTETVRQQKKEELLAKYGGREHLDAPPKSLLIAQTEEYVEYTSDGTLARGKDKQGGGIARSKYEEDVYINNHTQIWGSYWESGQWGYACCRQVVKNSYCTGKAGIDAKENMKELLEKHKQEQEARLKEDEAKATEAKSKKASSTSGSTKGLSAEKDDRKRPYNSLSGDYEVTPDQMEAYNKRRARFEDPMKDYIKDGD